MEKDYVPAEFYLHFSETIKGDLLQIFYENSKGSYRYLALILE